MIRVALDCRMADWTGVGRYSTGLVRALVARGDLDVVQVVSRADQAPVPDAAVAVASGHPFSPLGGRGMAAALRPLGPRLVHCLHFPTPIPPPHPLVVTLHDLGPLVVPGVMPSAARRAAYRWWNRRAARYADRVIVPSAFTDGDVLRLLAPEVPGLATRVRVVPEAADDFASGPVGELPDAATGFDGRYVLGFGSTRPHKRLPVLLEAFGMLAEDHVDLALVLVGEPRPEAVSAILGDGPAAHRVRFTGPVDDPELRALYAHAAAFAFPSVFEGFGLPPLEAMALGAPVVTTTAASLPEVVGDAALSVPPDDAPAFAAALRTLLEDSAERERVVEAGRERAAAFSWARAAEETVGVYRELVRG